VTKTNVMRILEQAKIPYVTKEYDFDEEDLSAKHAAESLGLSPERVFKTLVLRKEDGECFVCCVPACCEIDLKKAALASGGKKVALIAVKELEALTGYVRGGCSPIGMKKKFPIYIDETVTLFSAVSISAGRRGCQVMLGTDDLMSVSGAQSADLV
jgi:Cys-tRNA(Pro)/Cys-tRNA(Cys) deacylase